MQEGWYGEEYLILFTDEEVRVVSELYGISAMLPDFQVVGLLGWDDFILRSREGNVFTVATIPCDAKLLSPSRGLPSADELVSDHRFSGKVKWYITPIIFGGDATHGGNLRWVSLGEHAELVRWWNALYRSQTRTTNPGP